MPPPSGSGGGTRRLRRGQRTAPAQKDPNTVLPYTLRLAIGSSCALLFVRRSGKASQQAHINQGVFYA